MAVPDENDPAMDVVAAPPKRRRLESDIGVSPSSSGPASPSQGLLARPDNSPPMISILYVPGAVVPKLSKYMHQIVEVRIAAKYLITRNKEIQTRQIWGTDVYTDDSDVVAICQHTGKLILRPTAPAKILGVSTFFRVLPPRANYEGSMRFKLQSRNWAPPYHKCSIELVRVVNISQVEKLDPRTPGSTLKVSKVATGPNGRRTYTNKRFAPDATIMFNSWNEPCLKYCLGLIADRGTNSQQWTSTRLQREVIYLNSDGQQYELARDGESDHHDTYRWSRCSQPPRGTTLATRQVPVPAEQCKVLHSDIDWEEIEWGPTTVRVRDVDYTVQTIQFLPISA